MRLTSLAVKPASGGRGAEGELSGAEPGVGASAIVAAADAVATSDGVAGALAEGHAEVAPARKQGLEAVQRDLLL